MSVATTILEQLGGRRFAAMTGAKHFMSVEGGLQFGLPARFARNGYNKVSVTLRADDTAVEGVYCDQLQDVFRRETGLETTLGTLSAA